MSFNQAYNHFRQNNENKQAFIKESKPSKDINSIEFNQNKQKDLKINQFTAHYRDE